MIFTECIVVKMLITCMPLVKKFKVYLWYFEYHLCILNSVRSSEIMDWDKYTYIEIYM